MNWILISISHMGEMTRKCAKLSKLDVQIYIYIYIEREREREREKEREREMVLTNIQGSSLVDYHEIRVGGCNEKYVVYYNRNKRSGLAWFWMGV